ncbi:MAG: hypothetical protein HQL71_07385 [Magnetococcales bacterium]|nr:hypothetical protein [Magnetococcales bacterium]
MPYNVVLSKVIKEPGVKESTMMKSPCLRYRGDFMAMMFEKEDALIIKVSPQRVNELIDAGIGMEFNFTKKKFKEWVLIPQEFEEKYDIFIYEAFEYVKSKYKPKK